MLLSDRQTRLEVDALKPNHTVTRLCDHIGLATGLSPEDLKMRARALRQAGLLPPSPRGAGAIPATTLDAITILLAAMGQGLQSRSPDVVDALRDLRYQRTDAVETINENSGAVITRRSNKALSAAVVANLRAMNLGAILGYVIDQCRTNAGRQDILTNIKSLHIWQDGSMAMAETPDGQRVWYGMDENPNAPPPAVTTARVSFMSSVPASVLAILADLTVRPEELSMQTELPLLKTNAPPVPAGEASDDSVSPNPGANPVVSRSQPESTAERDSDASPNDSGQRGSQTTALGDARHNVVKLQPQGISPNGPRENMPLRAVQRT